MLMQSDAVTMFRIPNAAQIVALCKWHRIDSLPLLQALAKFI